MSTSKTAAKQSSKKQDGKPLAQDIRHNPVELGKPNGNLVIKADGAYAIHLGICSTCINLTNCLFVKAIRQPIHFCDEFDDKPGDGSA